VSLPEHRPCGRVDQRSFRRIADGHSHVAAFLRANDVEVHDALCCCLAPRCTA